MNDWYGMAEGFRATCFPLCQQVSAVELDTLVGWATNESSSSADPVGNPSNPLLDLPSSPLPMSLLYIIREEANQIIDKAPDKRLHHLIGSFDQSAMVSIGICLEEMITASLMKLAEAHVKKYNAEKDDKACQELWSLPPEECILALSKDGWREMEGPFLSTISPPILTAVPDEKPTSIFNLPVREEEDRQAMKNWVEAHELHASFLEENKDLFNV